MPETGNSPYAGTSLVGGCFCRLSREARCNQHGAAGQDVDSRRRTLLRRQTTFRSRPRTSSMPVWSDGLSRLQLPARAFKLPRIHTRSGEFVPRMCGCGTDPRIR